MKYKIIRYFEKEGKLPEQVKIVDSLRLAQEHCNDPRTRGFSRKDGKWFDGYREDETGAHEKDCCSNAPCGCDCHEKI